MVSLWQLPFTIFSFSSLSPLILKKLLTVVLHCLTNAWSKWVFIFCGIYSLKFYLHSQQPQHVICISKYQFNQWMCLNPPHATFTTTINTNLLIAHCPPSKMVTYICRRCGAQFTSLNAFNTHVNQKPKCPQKSKSTLEEIESPGSTENSQSPGSSASSGEGSVEKKTRKDRKRRTTELQ